MYLLDVELAIFVERIESNCLLTVNWFLPLNLISYSKELDGEVHFVNFAHPYRQREDQFIYVYHYKSGTSIK